MTDETVELVWFGEALLRWEELRTAIYSDDNAGMFDIDSAAEWETADEFRERVSSGD